MPNELQSTIDAAYEQRFEEVYVGQDADGYAVYDVRERAA